MSANANLLLKKENKHDNDTLPAALPFPEEIENKINELEQNKRNGSCKELNIYKFASLEYALGRFGFVASTSYDPGCELIQALNDHLKKPGSSPITSLLLCNVNNFSRGISKASTVRQDMPLLSDLITELSKECAFSSLIQFALDDSALAYQNGFGAVIATVSNPKRTWPCPTLQTFYGKQLAKLLNNNPSLNYLSLRGNSLGEAGGLELAKGLKNCLELTHLNLDSNDFGPKAGLEIAKSLESCTKLKVLSLRNNAFDSEALLVLAKSLNNKTNLESVLLKVEYADSKNQLDSKVYQEFMEVFQNLPNLSEFSLTDPKPGHELVATQALSTLLIKTSTLPSLRVSSVFYHEDGISGYEMVTSRTERDKLICDAFVDGLVKNRSLRSLIFLDDSRPWAYEQIFQALKAHPCLSSISIDVWERKNHHDIAWFLLNLLQDNPRITELIITQHLTTDNWTKAYETCLELVKQNQASQRPYILLILNELFQNNMLNKNLPTSLQCLMLDYLCGVPTHLLNRLQTSQNLNGINGTSAIQNANGISCHEVKREGENVLQTSEQAPLSMLHQFKLQQDTSEGYQAEHQRQQSETQSIEDAGINSTHPSSLDEEGEILQQAITLSLELQNKKQTSAR